MVSNAVKRHHDQVNLQKKDFIRGLLTVLQGKSMTIIVGNLTIGGQAWYWGSNLFTSMGQRMLTGDCVGFETSKSTPSEFLVVVFNGTTPGNPLQTVSPT